MSGLFPVKRDSLAVTGRRRRTSGRRRTHRAVPVLAAVGWVLSVGAVAVPTPVAAASGQVDARGPAIQAVLDQRAEAVVAGERKPFLDTLDPQAPAGFRAAQERLFEGLVSLRLKKYELVLRREVGDLSVGLARGYRGDVYLPEVEARYRLPVDVVDALDSFWCTFVLRDGVWRIAADTDLDELGLLSSRNLWDQGTVTSLQSDHFSILFHPSDAARARSLLELAEEAWGKMGDELRKDLPPRVVMMLPHDQEELRRVLQATFDLSSFVAFAVSGADRDEGWEWTAPRVFAQDANLARYGHDFQVETLHHELVHVAVFPSAGPNVPAWIHEGLADWASTGRPGPTRVAGSDGVLPLDYEFTTGGTPSIVKSYRESTSAMAFLAREKGEGAPLDLLSRLGRPRVEPGTARHHLDASLREVYGGDLARLEGDWSATILRR